MHRCEAWFAVNSLLSPIVSVKGGKQRSYRCTRVDALVLFTWELSHEVHSRFYPRTEDR